MKLKIAAAVAFVAGASLASAVWLVVAPSRLAPKKQAPPPASQLTRSSRVRPDYVRDWLRRHKESRAPAISPQGDNTQPATLAECTAQLSRLREADGECRRELAAQAADRALEEGKPLPFPPELESQFTRDTLVSNLTDAFKEAGVKGAVQIADCSEYPCIACGNLGDDVPRADINALLDDARAVGGAQSLGTYKDAVKKGTFFTYQVEETSLERTLFCQVFYPKPASDDVAAEITKRLEYRFVLLKGALH